MRVRIVLIALLTGLLFAGCAAPSSPSPSQPTAPAAAATPADPFGSAAQSPTSAAEAEPTAAAEPARPTFTVQRGEIVDQMTLDGRVSQVQQGIAFSEDGILKDVFVAVGDTVEQGQLLAELDLTDLQSQLGQARMVYEQDQRAVNQAIASGQIEVRQAQVDLEAARSNLEEARQPAKPDELSRARAAVQQADAELQTVRNNMSQDKNQALRELETAVTKLQIAQDLYGYARLDFEKRATEENRDLFIKRRDELVAAEDAVRRAQITYDTTRSNEVSQIQRAEGVAAAARAELDRLLAGPDRFAIADAEQLVKQAQINLDAAQQRAVADPELAKQAARSLAEVERIEQQISGRRLLAPLSGEVVALEAVPGMAVRAASPIMMVANSAMREILVEAPATAAARTNSRLIAGQTVQISFARYPGQAITGLVARVPGRTSADSIEPATEYAISYDPGDLALDIGDLAQVEVVLGKVTGALWLPPEAVRVNRDRAFVLMMSGDEEQRVEITTGVITDERVEILSGLVEGDVVVGEAVTR